MDGIEDRVRQIEHTLGFDKYNRLQEQLNNLLQLVERFNQRLGNLEESITGARSYGENTLDNQKQTGRY